MEITARQRVLTDYVVSMHGDQKRKYTNEPYWEHCYQVGLHAAENSVYLGFEIGICHDLIEDTECDLPDLLRSLISIGYTNKESLIITSCVDDLTDQYTKEKYPTLNRKERKSLEADRLGATHPDAQSVKYCDLINNTSSIYAFDPKFAKTYLKEKAAILSKMRKGNKDLLRVCEKQVDSFLETID